jgi:alanyl-tRNA synthetase
MTASQLRAEFLAFFEEHQHRRRASSSLVPDNDPSVLLTTAGMQQFKPYFLGQSDPMADFGAKRVTTVQKCFRTSDIDDVGDTSHLTFFEMLGNFSFGDYFKVEAIDFAWEFLTKKLHIPKERLWVTIFAGDDQVPRDTEAETAWLKYVPKERIVALDRKSNFWGPPGKSGSCGPSSEIHYHLNPSGTGTLVEGSSDFLEIWNLVFTEFNMSEDRVLTPLPQKNIDTGMGLERLAMVVQGKPNVFETDVYQPIMHAAEHVGSFGDSVEPDVQARRLRILADHLRGAVFLLADGVGFSNKDQGYILRRIVRRAADQFLRSDFTFDPMIAAIIKEFGDAYPELKEHQGSIMEQMNAELEQYRKILSMDVGAMVEKLRKGSDLVSATEADPGVSTALLTPDEAFTLFTTHGISLDRLQRLGFQFERGAVEAQVTAHQELSRAGAEKKFGGHGLTDETMATSTLSDEDKKKITRLHSATHLLQAALRQVLGAEVHQQGSDITPERLRFDFNFHRKLTDDERTQVELLVNEFIRADAPVTKEVMPVDQALQSGALAFFKEKYTGDVSVYTMGDFSKELCGGPHVSHTGEVGKFAITAEQSVGRGIRRVKGVVG